MKKDKVIAAGLVCIDIAPIFETGKVNDVSKILSPGKLTEVGAADIHTGGSVANTGLAMKILGADVSLMGKIGDDEFGRMVLGILDQYDASEGMIVDRDSSTSYTVVLVIPGVDRMFLHNPGANNTFSKEDLDFDKIKEAGLFHFGYPTIMESMYTDNGRELTEMFKAVKETGCMTSLDMSSVDENSKSGKADWRTILQNTLPYVDFFLPSVEEICYMLDKEKYQELQVRAKGGDITSVLSIEEDVVPLAEEILAMGCKFAMIKCGAAGFYYQTKDAAAFAELEECSGLDFSSFAGKAGFEKSYVPKEVVSGTGAGDTTIGAFLTAMVKGYSFKRCLQLAAATGASCVEAMDALGGLKSFEELIAKIDAGWEKNE